MQPTEILAHNNLELGLEGSQLRRFSRLSRALDRAFMKHYSDKTQKSTGAAK